MKQELKLIAAPPSMQPGGYVPEAFKNRLDPNTKNATLEARQEGDGWIISIRWQCPAPSSDIKHDTNLFADAAAIMVPTTQTTAWITMGDENNPIEAILWRADKDSPMRVDAKGFGSTVRSKVPDSWSTKAKWENGYWNVEFTLNGWAALNTQKRLAVAIWRGAEQDRGGLKSVTQDWVAI